MSRKPKHESDAAPATPEEEALAKQNEELIAEDAAAEVEPEPRTLGDLPGPGVTRVPPVDVHAGADPDRFVADMAHREKFLAAIATGEGVDKLIAQLRAWRETNFGPTSAPTYGGDDACRKLVEQLYTETKDKVGGHEEVLAARLARVLDVYHPART